MGLARKLLIKIIMQKSNQSIEIVRTTIKSLSSMSQVSCDALCKVLTKYYAHVRVSVVNNVDDLDAVVTRNPDLVFLGMKYILTEPLQQDSPKIWITKYLDDNNINYTGSNQAAHELELNKHLAKLRVKEAGLKTAPFWVTKASDWPAVEQPNGLYPLFVKPTNRGGGTGIDSNSVVYDFKHLLAKVNSISTELQSDSLIEEYLPGREFSVAILKMQNSDEFAVMPIELIAPLDKNNQRILSDSVKTADTESRIKVTDQIIKAKINSFALSAFTALGARDYGRIDLRLDKHGEVNFLEANLIPSLIDGYGSFPKACALNRGLDYITIVKHIAELGLNHVANRSVKPRTSRDVVAPSAAVSLI